jgi:branched-chain amino acid transport system ATP-binding protein
MQYVFELFPALVELRTKKAGFLSGGEQQMLAIGMALVVRPRLLLLDEPLLGLSPMMQKTLVNAIVSLNKKSGITVVLSEQFARPVLPIIDRGYVLENGCIAMQGDCKELASSAHVRKAYLGL